MRNLAFCIMKAGVSCTLASCSCTSSHLFLQKVVKHFLHVGGSGVRPYDGPDLKLFILVGWGRSFLSVAWPTGVQLVFFFCSGVSRLFGAQGSPIVGQLTKSVSPGF